MYGVLDDCPKKYNEDDDNYLKYDWSDELIATMQGDRIGITKRGERIMKMAVCLAHQPEDR